MRKILSIYCVLFISGQVIHARGFFFEGKKIHGATGATGATGPAGATGARGASGKRKHKYVSASANAQRLIFATTTVINFTNNLVEPTGIKHPLKGSDGQFQVRGAGVYLISWTIDIEWDNAAKNVIVLDLFNVSSSNSLYTTQKAFDTLPVSSGTRCETISGQILVALDAHDIISLRVRPLNGTVMINRGLLNMVCLND